MYRYFIASINIIKLFIERRKKAVKIGKKVRIDFRTRIKVLEGQIEIGDNVYLRSNSKNYHTGMAFPTTLFVDKIGAKIKVGKHSRLNGTYIHAQCDINIGENCVIAAGVNIIDSNGHELYSYNRTIGRDIPKPISILDNVWIGINCTILKGTQIGKNSVVAAGSVVKGQFEDNVLIQGNPARVIKKLEF